MACIVHRIVTSNWKENCFVVEDNDKCAVIIDPGDDAEKIISFLNENQIVPLAILNTHAHLDHICAVSKLKDHYNIPFFLHHGDKRLLGHANLYMHLFNFNKKTEIPVIDRYLENNDEIDMGGLHIKAEHIPGHTMGSVCFSIGNLLFTGDTLLENEIGRTDLPGGNIKYLVSSLKFISNKDPETIIYPGHGDSKALKELLVSNKSFIEAIQK